MALRNYAQAARPEEVETPSDVTLIGSVSPGLSEKDRSFAGSAKASPGLSIPAQNSAMGLPTLPSPDSSLCTLVVDDDK